MKSHLFVGTSIAIEEAVNLAASNVVIHPPIKRGDIPALLSACKAEAIAIVDGEFGQSLAVSPKEVLLALDAGITVLGGASMGALRAVELTPFGMIGIGQVYRWYHRQVLSRDDDVALSYALFGHFFVKLSIPMVEVKWAVETAVAAGIITQAYSSRILRCARRIPWRSRTWQDIFDAIDECSARSTELTLLFESPEYDIKRIDTIEIITKLNQLSSPV